MAESEGGKTVDYRQLDVWQRSMQLVKAVYPLAGRLPPVERFALADQIRRATVSVASNIAEGCNRDSNRELFYFLSVAKGSVAEVETQLYICIELEYFPEADALDALALCDDIKGMLYRFMQKVDR